MLDRGSIAIKNVSKSYPGQLALDAVDLEIRAGEVLGLVGENGSGKSTLVKVLTGFHRPDPGASVAFDGHIQDLVAWTLDDPDAVRCVHQDLALLHELTVAENLDLIRDDYPGWTRVLPAARRLDYVELSDTFAELGLEVDLRAPVKELAAHERVLLAMARAVYRVRDTTRVLILDEPTTALSTVETERVFRAVNRLKERGLAIIYISHILHEVIAHCDRVAVLRNGRLVDCFDNSVVNERLLIASMLDLKPTSKEPSATDRDLASPSKMDDPALRVENLQARDLRGVSFSAWPGEILGIAGITGSGVDTILGAIFDDSESWAGQVWLSETIHDNRSPRSSIGGGLAYVPRDRLGSGLIAADTICENMGLMAPDGRSLFSPIKRADENSEIVKWLQAFQVNTADPSRPIFQLSGGNQQKVLIAKWVRTAPKVLMVQEPTQAVDIGAKQAIEGLLRGLSNDGTCVIVASTEASDLARLCSRVIVMRNGRIEGELGAEEVSDSAILRIAGGPDST